MAERIDKVSSKEKSRLDALARHKAAFMAAFRGEKDWRKQKREWQRFYDGDQLSEEEKQALKERNQPEVVINCIKPKVDGITGIQLQTKTIMKAYDRGTGDFESAKYITEALRYIDYQNQFEDEEAEAFEETTIQGRSWYKHEVVYQGLDVEFRDYYVSNDDIFLDPYCKRADLSDAKYVCESIWMDLEDAIELFPQFEAELTESVKERSDFSTELGGSITKENRPDAYAATDGDDDTVWFDRERKRVRIVTRYYREPVRREFQIHPSTGIKDVSEYTAKEKRDLIRSLPDVEFITEVGYRLNSATFCAVEILEERHDIRSWDEEAKFPLVPVLAFVTRDEKRMPYGMVKQMVDPQKEINKRRSKMLHILNSTQIIAESGAVKDVAEARAEIAKPDGYLVVKPGMRFEVVKQTDVAASQFSLLQESKSEINEAGVSREIQGNVPADQSGRAIRLREQVTVRPLRKLFKNLRFARKRLNLLRLEDIQHYWTGEKLIKITDDPNAAAVVLNKPKLDEMGNPVVDENGNQVLENNVTLGKYDLIIEEAPDTLNLASEQFDSLMKLASAGAPIPIDMLIESSALPNKRQVIERLNQQQQAQAQAAQLAALQGQLPPGATGGMGQ